MDGKVNFRDIRNHQSFLTLTHTENTTEIANLITLPPGGDDDGNMSILIISCFMVLLFITMGIWAWYRPLKLCLRKSINPVDLTYEEPPPRYEVALKMPKPSHFKYDSTKYPLTSVIASETDWIGRAAVESSDFVKVNIHTNRTNSFSGNEPFVVSNFAHRMNAHTSLNHLPTYQEYMYNMGLDATNMDCNPPKLTTFL